MDIQKVIDALTKNGFTAELAQDRAAAVNRVQELIPEGSEVMTMTSVTLDTLGLTTLLNESEKYISLRNKLSSMDSKTEGRQKRQIAAAPDFSVGSVHAVSEEGVLYIASNTGSQLPAHVYAAEKVIFVIGTQKIVPDQEAAFKRIYDHVLPLESQRANAAYGITTGSFVSKLLIINREIKPNRIHVILVPENLGF